MTIRIISIDCDSPAVAEEVREQVKAIGFPVQGDDTVTDGNLFLAKIWIDMGQTDGIEHPMRQIIDLGLRPDFTSAKE